MRNENKPAVMMKIRFYFKDPNYHIHEDKVEPWKHKVRITTVVFFIFLFIQLRQVKLHEWHAYNTNTILYKWRMAGHHNS
jgi:hypothetical protein